MTRVADGPCSLTPLASGQVHDPNYGRISTVFAAFGARYAAIVVGFVLGATVSVRRIDTSFVSIGRSAMIGDFKLTDGMRTRRRRVNIVVRGVRILLRLFGQVESLSNVVDGVTSQTPDEDSTATRFADF